jgi:protein-S-isoprenylcysteine O-methyltransferase Ste14
MLRVFLKANMYAVLVIGLFLVLLPWAVIGLFGWHPLSSLLNSGQTLRAVGLVIGLIGGCLSYTCMTTFVMKGRGTAFPTDPPKTFVILGPYRYVRNPMYIGNLILAVGVGLLVDSATYLVYTAVLAVVTHLYIVLSEEPKLRRRFGREYADYQKATNRWIPRFN